MMQRDEQAIDALREQVSALVAEREHLHATVQRLELLHARRAERDLAKRAEREQRQLERQARLDAAAEAANAVKVIDSQRLAPPLIAEAGALNTQARTQALTDPAELYLDLLKNTLTRLATGERPPFDPYTGEVMELNVHRRIEGSDWPSEAETMAGLLRLDNVQACVTDVLRQQVPGDLVETGVWRGGVTILMRAILKAYGDPDRSVWAADSFAGLPVPDAERYPADDGFDLSPTAGFNVLAIPVEEVQANFARYGLLDERVRFLVGWFKDTLPTAPIEQIAVLRLDGDLYESTMDALTALYPKLSVGGYLIVDDYLSWEPCKRAVDDYRAAHGIDDVITPIDWTAAYWQRRR